MKYYFKILSERIHVNVVSMDHIELTPLFPSCFVVTINEAIDLVVPPLVKGRILEVLMLCMLQGDRGSAKRD